jgi:hypothetical protein
MKKSTLKVPVFVMCMDCFTFGNVFNVDEEECPKCESTNLKTARQIANALKSFRNNRDDDTNYCMEEINDLIGN